MWPKNLKATNFCKKILWVVNEKVNILLGENGKVKDNESSKIALFLCEYLFYSTFSASKVNIFWVKVISRHMCCSFLVDDADVLTKWSELWIVIVINFQR